MKKPKQTAFALDPNFAREMGKRGVQGSFKYNRELASRAGKMSGKARKKRQLAEKNPNKVLGGQKAYFTTLERYGEDFFKRQKSAAAPGKDATLPAPELAQMQDDLGRLFKRCKDLNTLIRLYARLSAILKTEYQKAFSVLSDRVEQEELDRYEGNGELLKYGGDKE